MMGMEGGWRQEKLHRQYVRPGGFSVIVTVFLVLVSRGGLCELRFPDGFRSLLVNVGEDEVEDFVVP